MKRLMIAMAAFLAAGVALAQSPSGASATGLVVGSGNYFSPIVRDLDAAIAFYRDGLGLEVRGPPGDAAANPALRDMFGLPDARIRWAVARTPAAPGGVEIVEISNAGGRALERKLEDPGANCLVVTVRDLDGTLARLRKLGAPMVSIGGEPVTIGGGTRIVIVRDPDGNFVELSQPAELPSSAPPSANVIGVRVRLAVADVVAAARLYQNGLGLQERAPLGEFGNNDAVLRALGLTGGRYRVAQQNVPGSGLMYDFVDFDGVEPCRGESRTSARRACSCACATSMPRSRPSSAPGGKSFRRAAGRSLCRPATRRCALRSCAIRTTCSQC
jgi:catechol 2,3-dioxygenase-like lactoylglutathione lyase family enzyme